MAVAGGIRTDGWAFAFISDISRASNGFSRLNVPDSEPAFQHQAERGRGPLPGLFPAAFLWPALGRSGQLPGRSTPPGPNRRKLLVVRQASFATDPATQFPLSAAVGQRAVVTHPHQPLRHDGKSAGVGSCLMYYKLNA